MKIKVERRVFIWLSELVLLSLLVSCSPSIEDQIKELASISVEEADDAIREKIRDFQVRAQSNPLNPNAIGELGVLYELHGFSQQAVIAYEIASTLDPEESKWPYYQAILLSARFNANDAVKHIERAIGLNPQYAPMRIMYGNLLMNLGNPEVALAKFKEAEVIGSDPYVFIGQAQAYMALGIPDKAIDALEKSGELVNHPNVIRLRATNLIRLGQRADGEKLMNSLPQMPPIRWSDPLAEQKGQLAVSNLSDKLADATALIRGLSLQSALALLEGLRQEYPTNKHVLQLLSDAYELSKRPLEALATLTVAIGYEPNFYPLRMSAARILREQGNLDEAIRHLDAAIEFDPTLVWAFNYKAQILMSKKRWLEASVVLDQAIGVDEEDPDLYTHLGICLGFMNRWPEARNLFLVALNIDDSHVPSYINLARAHTILGDEEGALNAVRLAKANGASANQISVLEAQRSQIKQMQIQ